MLRIILKTSTTLLLLAVIPHGQHHGLAASICFLAAIDPIDGGLITLTIQAFGRAAGIGLTKTYQLINSGVLETVVVGKRRLIVVASYRRFIQAQLDAKRTPATQPLATPPRRDRAARSRQRRSELL